MGVFTLTATASRMPIGLLTDRIGRKRFLLCGLSLFAVGMLGYLRAPSIRWIVPFRILHGIGWSGCTTAVTTLAADVIPQKRRGELIGYAAMASNIGGAIGPIVGFAIFHRFGYDGVFLGATAVLVASLLIGATISEPARHLVTRVEPLSWFETVVVKETMRLGAPLTAFVATVIVMVVPLFWPF